MPHSTITSITDTYKMNNELLFVFNRKKIITVQSVHYLFIEKTHKIKTHEQN